MTPEQNIQFLTQGYLVMRNALSPDELRRAQEAFDRAAERARPEWERKVAEGKAPKEYYGIGNLFDTDDIFVELVNHPVTFPVVRGAIGEDVQIEGSTGRVYPPGPTYVHWHSDIGGMLGLNKEASPNFRAKLHYFLSDVPEDRGCLGFVPGSHRVPLKDLPKVARMEDMPGHIRLPMKAGDAVLFHVHGWHTVFPNTSDRPRKSLIYCYSHFWMKQNTESARPTELSRFLNDPVRRQLFGVGDEGKSRMGQRLPAMGMA